MASSNRYPPSQAFIQQANLNTERYQSLYEQSIKQPEQFWAEQAERFISWDKKWQSVANNTMLTGDINWFEGGQLNVSYNCLDRHLETRGDQAAIIWEGDNPADSLTLSYKELHQQVCKLANVYKELGVKRGDRVCIYMPMIPEAAIAMLACTRIGAVHSVVFGGFSPEALKDRILDASCKLVVTADEGVRGGKLIPLKNNVDQALEHAPCVEHVIMVKRTGNAVDVKHGRDVWYHDAMLKAQAECPYEIMDSESPLFILYTSGSTGKPKGVEHSTAGYLLHTSMTYYYTFDHKEGDIFWCSADVGWITGHSYCVYAPLANGGTTVLFEGVPTYPDAGRCWQTIDKHNISIFYTAPTAIRALMAAGDNYVTQYQRSSLRLLGTVGEPINPEAWQWYYNTVGEGRCPIVDTWWQTETGGHMLTPIPGATATKPGSATLPMLGIEPVILDPEGNELSGEAEGLLAIKQSWPSQIRGVYGNPERYLEAYFKLFPGYYFSGDGARRDADGYYWITGRVDDVLNVSGHRLGTAEIESAIGLCDAVAESAVVGYPHDIKGQAVYAYIILKDGQQPSDTLKQEILNSCTSEIGAIAKPDKIQWVSGLPKTRSGKIMRRILRKIAANETENLGDTSTLADPTVIDTIIAGKL